MFRSFCIIFEDFSNIQYIFRDLVLDFSIMVEKVWHIYRNICPKTAHFLWHKNVINATHYPRFVMSIIGQNNFTLSMIYSSFFVSKKRPLHAVSRSETSTTSTVILLFFSVVSRAKFHPQHFSYCRKRVLTLACSVMCTSRTDPILTNKKVTWRWRNASMLIYRFCVLLIHKMAS